MDTAKRFDPAKYLRTIRTRGRGEQTYLPVAARLLWLRADHPHAQVVTEVLRLDEKGAVFKATVTLPGGGVAVGHGSETAGDFGDFIEKAETKAIGRALATLGYGTEFAEMQDDPALAAATEMQPAPSRAPDVPARPAPAEPPAPAAPSPAPPAATQQPRPERFAGQQPPPEPPAAPPERTLRPERFQRTERTERTERAEPAAPAERPAPASARPLPPERLARAALPAPSARPERPEHAEPAEEAPAAPAAPPRPTPTPLERPLRPERLSRTPAATPAPPEPEPPAATSEPPAPTPLRRTGRTLGAGRTFTVTPSAAPAPEPARLPARVAAEPPPRDNEGDDELDLATISTTSFWRWARSKGYADRRAVEAATGKSMDAMTPREAFYRLREAIAREGGA